MMTSAILLVVTLLFVLNSCEQHQTVQDDYGFLLNFVDSTNEVSNHQLYFNKPLPKWLKGTLVRNGAGRFSMGDRNMTHAFDGYSLLTSYKFTTSGRVIFNFKYLQTDFYNASKAENDVAPYLLFDSVRPAFGFVDKAVALLRGIDNMNVNVHKLGTAPNRTEFLAVNDFWRVYQFDLSDLSTVARIQPPVPKLGEISSFLSMLSSAHPLPEYGTTNLINFVSTIDVNPLRAGGGSVSLVRMKSARRRELIARWEVDRVPYMHSFAATRRHTILFGCPLYVDLKTIIERANPLKSLRWLDGTASDIYVIDTSSGRVRRTKFQTNFTLHHVNAFEAGNKIYADAVVYPDIEFLKNMELATLRQKSLRDRLIPTRADLKRFVIDLDTLDVKVVEHKSRPGLEFITRLDLPTINENYRFKPYCFVYGLVLKSDGVNFANMSVVKKDIGRDGDSKGDRFWMRPFHYPSEAVFVANPAGRSEDDGVLLTVVLDGLKRASYIAVIDARTMTTISYSYLPVLVPYTIHGKFFEDF